MGHAKCAIKNMVQAYSGEVKFGISQFASFMTGCGASCYGNNSNTPLPGCDINCYNAEIVQFGGCAACGPMDNVLNPATARGGRVLVGMDPDTNPPGPSNVGAITQWVDNTCTSNLEATNVPSDGPAYGLTPLNGLLRDMQRYFQTGWSNPDTFTPFFATPLSAGDPSCRPVYLILLTDGDETCDSQQDAYNAAAALYTTGATFGAKTFHIKTRVINFAGGNQTNTDQLADMGDDGVDNNSSTSYFATNETQLSQAMANIIAKRHQPRGLRQPGQQLQRLHGRRLHPLLRHQARGLLHLEHAGAEDDVRSECVSVLQLDERGPAQHVSIAVSGQHHQRQSDGGSESVAVHDASTAGAAAELALLRPERDLRQRRQQLQLADGRKSDEVRQPAALPAARDLQRTGRQLRRDHRQRGRKRRAVQRVPGQLPAVERDLRWLRQQLQWRGRRRHRRDPVWLDAAGKLRRDDELPVDGSSSAGWRLRGSGRAEGLWRLQQQPAAGNLRRPRQRLRRHRGRRDPRNALHDPGSTRPRSTTTSSPRANARRAISRATARAPAGSDRARKSVTASTTIAMARSTTTCRASATCVARARELAPRV